MSLFESVLASIVASLFIPLLVSLGNESASLRLSEKSMRTELARDSFIAASFDSLSVSALEEWKEMCGALYPNVKIEVTVLGSKGDLSLYECSWEEHKKLSVKKTKD